MLRSRASKIGYRRRYKIALFVKTGATECAIMHPSERNGELTMKKMLSVVALSLALVGCMDKPKTYICGNEAFEVTSDYMKVVQGKSTGVVMDNISKNQYKLFTPIGTVFYTVNENTIDIKVGVYQNTLTCEVK